MFQQYREFPFEDELKEIETRLIARGFKKALEGRSSLNPKEYRVKAHFGTQASTQEPLRYGIEWMEG